MGILVISEFRKMGGLISDPWGLILVSGGLVSDPRGLKPDPMDLKSDPGGLKSGRTEIPILFVVPTDTRKYQKQVRRFDIILAILIY